MPDARAPVDGDATTDVAPTIVSLPSLGADMDVGTVIEWRVSVGDRVERGDVVAVVSTEKSDIDVETWDSGWVIELIAPLDRELPVGEPLLALGAQATPGTAPTTSTAPAVDPPSSSTPTPPPTPARAPAQRQPSAASLPSSPNGAGTSRGVRASPRARKIATDRGIDLADLVGSGPDGAIVAADVPAATRVSEDAAPGDRMRRAIADRMVRSNQDIPHYHLERDIDLTAALEWLADRNASRPITERVVPAALLACAVARAAAQVPQCNGTWTDDHLEPSATVDLGLVVSLRSGGLLAPTVSDADQIGLDEMMSEIKEMVVAARSGQLRSRWMQHASITLTNLGELGADRVAGIIFPPQVALVGFGRIVDRPWVVDGSVCPRSVVTATLSADHRASDGVDGSRFLAALAATLASPDMLDT